MITNAPAKKAPPKQVTPEEAVTPVSESNETLDTKDKQPEKALAATVKATPEKTIKEIPETKPKKKVTASKKKQKKAPKPKKVVHDNADETEVAEQIIVPETKAKGANK